MRDYLRADLGENVFGYWFKLDPIQHAYEIQFAERLAQRGLEANGGGVSITDFGCGNGDKAEGLIKVIQASNYTGPISYSAIDLNPQSVIEAGTKIGSLSRTEVSCLLTGNFTDLNLIETLICKGMQYHNLNVLLFCDSLHWLQQNEIVELLAFLSHHVPSGTQVLANVCSIWNRTSIGTADNPRQRDNIEKITAYLKVHEDEPLTRTASEIEYSQNMTHFTPDSLSHTFVKAGFTVSDCRWWRNIFFPNGRPDLYENVNLTAYKA